MNKMVLYLALALGLTGLANVSMAGILNRPASLSTSGLGMSGAVTASGEGAAAMSGNPAGLIWVENWELEIGLLELWTNFGYHQDPLLGGQNWGAEEEDFQFPEFFLAHRFSDDLVLGFGFWVPYGLAGDYSDYAPTFQSEMMISHIGLGAGYQLSDRWSVGAVIKAIYSDLSFKLPMIDPTTGAYLGFTDSEANGWGIGASFGVLYVNEPWRFGISYDLPAKIDLDGHTDLPLAVGIPRDNFSADAHNPSRLGVGIARQMTDRWLTALDWYWTDYHNNDALNADYDLLPTSVIPLDWGDVYSIHWGNEYVVNEWLTLRGGAAWMSSGTTDDALIPSIPDVPGWDVTLGAGIKINDCTELNIAGIYAWGDRDINFSPVPLRAAAGEHEADLWGIGVGVKFEF